MYQLSYQFEKNKQFDIALPNNITYTPITHVKPVLLIIKIERQSRQLVDLGEDQSVIK